MVCEINKEIGQRIKEERERLNYSPDDFASFLDKHKASVARYEKGERSMDQEDLHALYKHGVDIFYIITGKRIQEKELTVRQFTFLNKLEQLEDKQESLLMRIFDAVLYEKQTS